MYTGQPLLSIGRHFLVRLDLPYIGPFCAGPYWRYFFVTGVIRAGVRGLN